MTALGRELTDADRGKLFCLRDKTDLMFFVGFAPRQHGLDRTAVFSFPDGSLTRREVNGCYLRNSNEHPHDIISEWREPPKPVTREVWVTFFDDGGQEIWRDKKRAKECLGPDCIACKRFELTFTTGEGL